MINADNIWDDFLSEARIYQQSQELYLSPTGEGVYKIVSTLNDVVHISRVSRQGSGETIGIVKFRTAINRINQFNNAIPKGRIYEHVAEEVTLVELLPFLDWDETGHFILISNPLVENINNINVDEAQNDDPNIRIQTNIRERKGQKKFRDKLLSLYESQCAVSRCNVHQVLHACHIYSHSVCGINLSTNGLILRSDIHDLFDQNLIAIHPVDLTINLNISLFQTEYYKYHGKILKSRNDNKKPSQEALQQRWLNF